MADEAIFLPACVFLTIAVEKSQPLQRFWSLVVFALDQNVRMACSRRDQGREIRRADLRAMEPWLLMGPWAWAWEAMACVWHPYIHFLMFCNIMLHHLLRMAALWDASCRSFAIL